MLGFEHPKRRKMLTMSWFFVVSKNQRLVVDLECDSHWSAVLPATDQQR